MVTIKHGPFKVPKLTEDHPLYGRLLAGEIEKLPALPDFYKHEGLLIFSDFGGEHQDADFTTYSILICPYANRLIFEEKIKDLRIKYGLNNPWKELSFKSLNYGPISRSLEEFLDISNNFIHGILITISVEKKSLAFLAIIKKMPRMKL